MNMIFWPLPNLSSLTMSSKKRTFKTLLLAGVAAGALSFVTSDVVSAGCGCESQCTTCAPVKSRECTCNCSKFNCLDKAMSKLKGGMHGIKHGMHGMKNKLFSFSLCKSGCDSGCDDACDAAMMDELMMAPMDHHHAAPMHTHSHSAPMHDMHHAPHHDAPHHAVPHHDGVHEHTPMPEVSPRVPMTDPGTARDNLKLPEPTDRNPPPPVRMNAEPEVKEQPADEGSLFDTLSDPFKDDARVQSIRSVRPSTYVRPLQTAPLSRNGQSSRRRVSRDAK